MNRTYDVCAVLDVPFGKQWFAECQRVLLVRTNAWKLEDLSSNVRDDVHILQSAACCGDVSIMCHSLGFGRHVVRIS